MPHIEAGRGYDGQAHARTSRRTRGTPSSVDLAERSGLPPATITRHWAYASSLTVPRTGSEGVPLTAQPRPRMARVTTACRGRVAAEPAGDFEGGIATRRTGRSRPWPGGSPEASAEFTVSNKTGQVS